MQFGFVRVLCVRVCVYVCMCVHVCVCVCLCQCCVITLHPPKPARNHPSIALTNHHLHPPTAGRTLPTSTGTRSWRSAPSMTSRCPSVRVISWDRVMSRHLLTSKQAPLKHLRFLGPNSKTTHLNTTRLNQMQSNCPALTTTPRAVVGETLLSSLYSQVTACALAALQVGGGLGRGGVAFWWWLGGGPAVVVLGRWSRMCSGDQ